MSTLYAASLSPSKPEALALLLSRRAPGAEVSAEGIERIAAYRFDDPAGQVGCETHIVATEALGTVQVPLTYRGAPLAGAPAEALVTTMQHSVLGERWVYDAAHDPVYVEALIRVMAEGGAGAEQFMVREDGSLQPVSEGLARVRGTGRGGEGVIRADAAAESVRAREAVQEPEAGDSGLPAVEQRESSTLIRFRGVAVEVRFLLAGSGPAGGEAHQLVGTWDGQAEPVLLATYLA